MAYDRLHESLDTLMVTFQVLSIVASPIVDIFPYHGEDRELSPEEAEKYHEDEVASSGLSMAKEAFASDEGEDNAQEENNSESGSVTEDED